MSVVANRYARALMDVLHRERAEAGLLQLQSFAALLKEQKEARSFLQNPSIAGGRRNRMLKEISEALSFDRRVSNFVNVLVDRNRLTLLEEIIVQYQKLIDEHLGIVRAHVTAARSLDAVQQRELASKLETITGKRVLLEVVVDPSLIGGVIAQVGSTIYDGSVRQQLQAFKSRLVGE